ncbi:alpha/beta hydrolase [Rhodococcus sp. 06-621-2]|nr:alpha/beta hydrolase [Rhodococcus sp. 06-621-2]OZC55528.1 alpha/beta hydrolase [Rhodococcus sp. 06-621-2]
MPELEHSFAHLPDVTLHYVTAGTGDRPIVLLHGYPQTWFSWIDVIQPLVDNGFRCIVPDLRGLGDSSRPATGYDKRTVAGDIHGLLTTHLGIDTRVPVVGHDWGGVVGFALAAHFDVVSHLAVVDVSIPGDGQPDLGQGGRRWHHTFLRTLDLPEALIAGREEVWLRWFYENYGHNKYVLSEESIREFLRTYTSPGALRAGFAYYRSIDQDISDNRDLPPLAIPCLAVGGASGMGRGRVVEDSLSRMASDVRGVVFDECGHWVPEEKPDELVNALLRFL